MTIIIFNLFSLFFFKLFSTIVYYLSFSFLEFAVLMGYVMLWSECQCFQNSRVGILMPNVMVLGGEVFEGAGFVQSRTPLKRLSSSSSSSSRSQEQNPHACDQCSYESPKAFLPLPPCEDTVRSPRPRKGPSLDYSSPLILDFQSPEPFNFPV